MDRRETIKTLLLTGLAAPAALHLTGCSDSHPIEQSNVPSGKGYGRTPAEQVIDAQLDAMPSIFGKSELTTIAILCDIILPASNTAGSATEAGVVAFIDFIVKDMPAHQLPLKGGLMWLERESLSRYNRVFAEISESERISILDEIAYPDKAKPHMQPGVAFFNRLRNLTLTGYYTSKMGIEDLGYVGNLPNIWDGVPEDELRAHGLSYEPDWLAKCVDQSKRLVQAEWDENGNLIS